MRDYRKCARVEQCSGNRVFRFELSLIRNSGCRAVLVGFLGRFVDARTAPREGVKKLCALVTLLYPSLLVAGAVVCRTRSLSWVQLLLHSLHSTASQAMDTGPEQGHHLCDLWTAQSTVVPLTSVGWSVQRHSC